MHRFADILTVERLFYSEELLVRDRISKRPNSQTHRYRAAEAGHESVAVFTLSIIMKFDTQTNKLKKFTYMND